MTGQKDKLRNVNIERITPLDPPAEYWRRLPGTDAIERRVAQARSEIVRIICGVDDRMLIIVGPCSIHDTKAGLEYARRLKELAEQFDAELFYSHDAESFPKYLQAPGFYS